MRRGPSLGRRVPRPELKTPRRSPVRFAVPITGASRGSTDADAAPWRENHER